MASPSPIRFVPTSQSVENAAGNYSVNSGLPTAKTLAFEYKTNASLALVKTLAVALSVFTLLRNHPLPFFPLVLSLAIASRFSLVQANRTNNAFIEKATEEFTKAQTLSEIDNKELLIFLSSSPTACKKLLQDHVGGSKDKFLVLLDFCIEHGHRHSSPSNRIAVIKLLTDYGFLDLERVLKPSLNAACFDYAIQRTKYDWDLLDDSQKVDLLENAARNDFNRLLTLTKQGIHIDQTHEGETALDRCMQKNPDSNKLNPDNRSIVALIRAGADPAEGLAIAQDHPIVIQAQKQNSVAKPIYPFNPYQPSVGQFDKPAITIGQGKNAFKVDTIGCHLRGLFGVVVLSTLLFSPPAGLALKVTYFAVYAVITYTQYKKAKRKLDDLALESFSHSSFYPSEVHQYIQKNPHLLEKIAKDGDFFKLSEDGFDFWHAFDSFLDPRPLKAFKIISREAFKHFDKFDCIIKLLKTYTAAEFKSAIEDGLLNDVSRTLTDEQKFTCWVENCSPNKAKQLTKLGFDVNANRNADGMLPLHFAIKRYKNNERTILPFYIEALISAGAKPELKINNEEGQSATELCGDDPYLLGLLKGK